MSRPGENLEPYDLMTKHPWIKSDHSDKADRSINIWQAISLMRESLNNFQAKFERVKSWDPWTLLMPHARYLHVGDTLINRTKHLSYKVEEVQSLVYNIRENLVSFKDRDGYDPTNYEEWGYSGQKVVISGPIEPDLTDLLEIQPQSENTQTGRFVKNLFQMTAAYPNEQQEADPWVDTITYLLTRRQLGGGGKEIFSGPYEYRPRLRGRYTDDQQPTKSVSIYGQHYENVIQFDLWAKTSTEADQFVAYFEDFMRKHFWVWKRNGVVNIFFLQQYRDEEVTKWRNDITNRTVAYYVRTEYLETREDEKFTEINTDLYGPMASGVYGATVPRNIKVANGPETIDIPYYHLIT